MLAGNESAIAPLRNLPVITDLTVYRDSFFDKWIAAEGVHQGAVTRDDPIVPIDQAAPIHGLQMEQLNASSARFVMPPDVLGYDQSVRGQRV